MKAWIVVCLFTFFTLAGYTEKPFVIIIPSYNNSQWYERNLHSVIHQAYTNYRIIYIDDCSNDATHELVQSYITANGQHRAITLIKNDERSGALANIYYAVHSCNDYEIALLVDGDDWLAHQWVLAYLNEIYQDPTIWLTYGQYISYPENKIGLCRPLPDWVIAHNAYREFPWCSSHLRTFYAGLFKHIVYEDLLYEGTFFDVTWDMAILFPLLEMSGGHFTCIESLQYVYNCATPLNDFKTKLARQLQCEKVIRARQKYAPLAQLPFER